jgi:flagellar hook-length control protein FliK
MNPLSAPMPSAIMPMMTGQTPTTGVFEDMFNISATLVDAPPTVSVDVVTPATSSFCAPAITLAQPPLAEVQSWAATEVLPQPTAPDALNRAMTIVLPPPAAPENSIEDAGTVAAEKAEASSPPIDLTLVPAPTVHMRPPVSAPAHIPVTPLAPQVCKFTNRAETPKPLNATPTQTLAPWLPNAPQKPVKRADAMPTVRPDTLPAPLLTKENKPQLPGSLPALNLGLVDNPLFSFEPQSGIRAAQPSVAPTAPRTDTPIAELRQLVITADGEWIDALARDIVSHAASDNQLTFTLVPEHLGQLDVAVTTDNGKVDILLETSTQAAAQAISAEQARLIEDLRHAGLKLGQFDMSNRQNGNGQQQAPRPDSQHTDNNSTPAQASASSKAQGRFA